MIHPPAMLDEDLVQGSEEWFSASAGHLGASQIADALAKTKSGWGASRQALMAQLICERLTGLPTTGYKSAPMQWGNDIEQEARLAYEMRRGLFVTRVGLIRHPTIAWTHASPDGLVGDDGLVEFKCPESHTHLGYLLAGRFPDRLRKQVDWQMACSGRQWCDLVSYDPRFPGHLQLMIMRIERDATVISELEKDVRLFLADIEAKIARLSLLDDTLRIDTLRNQLERSAS